MKKIVLLTMITLGSLSEVIAQWGVFVEYDVEASDVVTQVEGAVMESRLGGLYQFTDDLRVRAGASRLGRRDIRGGYYSKSSNSFDFSTYESISLYQNGLSSGYSFFGGLEFSRNKFLVGLDLHWARREITNGSILGNYYLSSSTGLTINENYSFSTKFSSFSYFKTNLKAGYTIYSKPRGAISLYMNISHDSDESGQLKMEEYDAEVLELDNRITNGQTSGQTISDFINSSYLYYQRQSFSFGLNVRYIFNVDVDKPEILKIGG